ncbi:acyl-CoA dehydrogenase family protein [Sporosarcina sp. FSL K6-1522]|uniref:acyl-CoA dehydrogenase family protein n=1 Tax=Sporosarcina sp. FSL K6-1522 TaxID=2921554 RepID=UPI00315A6B8C
MDFSLNETQAEFKRTAQKFFEEKCTVAALKGFEESEGQYSPALYKELADLGFLGLIVPEEYGGFGGSLMDLALIVEEAGWAILPSPFLSTVAYGIVPLLASGTEEQKQELLPKIVAGELVFSGALSEPQAHYALNHITTAAEKSGKDYTLSGKKLFVPYGQSADYLVTLARTEKGTEATHDGLSLFLVKGKQPAIQTAPLASINGEGLVEIDFRNVALSETDVLGEANKGWSLTQKTLQMATALQCIEMAGVLRRALDVTTEYVKGRTQFERAIGSYQSVQHRLAKMYTVVEGGQLAAYQAISRLEAGASAEKELAVAKVWLSKEGQSVLVGAHQLHGGMGLDMDYPLQYCFRRFKSLQLNIGSASAHLTELGKSLVQQTGESVKEDAAKQLVF